MTTFWSGSVPAFSFDITFVATLPSSISNAPVGWTVTINPDGNNASTIQVTHNRTAIPITSTVWGLGSISNNWTNRIIGTGSIAMNYVTSTNTNILRFTGVNTTSAAASGNSATIWIIFSA